MPLDGFAFDPLPCLTVESLRAAVPGCRTPDVWVEPLRDACLRYGINTPIKLAAFVAQVSHESGDFARVSENLNYSPQGLLATFPSRVTPSAAQRLGRTPGKPADQRGIANLVYGKRMGNVFENDGYDYRGAGLIQLTGYNNHDAAAVEFEMPTSEVGDFLRTIRGATLSAAWFFAKQAKCCDVAASVDTVSKRINGGTNGLEDRRARFARAKKAFRA